MELLAFLVYSFVLMTTTQCGTAQYTYTSTGNEGNRFEYGKCGQLNENYLSNTNTTNTTAVDEFPWIGFIEYINETTQNLHYNCPVTLISAKHLVATHLCVANKQRTVIAVHLGGCNVQSEKSENSSINECRYPIKEIVLHPEVCQYKNFIALLILEAEVTFTPNIQPICLPPPELIDMMAADNFAEYELIASGIGRNIKSSNISTLHKAKYIFEWVNLEGCRNFYKKKAPEIIANDICGYGSRNRDTFLMSGSLLMGIAGNRETGRYFYIVGLASRGPQTTKIQRPEIYVKFAPQMDWILKNMLKTF